MEIFSGVHPSNITNTDMKKTWMSLFLLFTLLSFGSTDEKAVTGIVTQ
jgi:hypothetical protein